MKKRNDKKTVNIMSPAVSQFGGGTEIMSIVSLKFGEENVFLWNL